MTDKKLLLLSLLAGVTAVVFVLSWMSSVKGESVQVLVASRPIAAGEPFSPENLDLIDVPFAPGEALQGADLDLVTAGTNSCARRPIAAGAIVMSGDVQVGPEVQLSERVPGGRRALAIPVSRETSVAGHVRPGNEVEILVARKLGQIERREFESNPDAREEDLVSRVDGGPYKVLAVGDTFGTPGNYVADNGYDTVTVEVDEAQARLILQKMARLGSWDGITLLLVGDEGRERSAEENLTFGG